MLDDCGRIGAHEVFAVLADPDEQRTPLSGHDDLPRIATAHDSDSVRSLDLGERGEYRILESGVLSEGFIDEMDDRLRVGLGLERVPEIGELGAKYVRILENSVVNQCDVAPLVPMRVRSALMWLSRLLKPG